MYGKVFRCHHCQYRSLELAIEHPLSDDCEIGTSLAEAVYTLKHLTRLKFSVMGNKSGSKSLFRGHVLNEAEHLRRSHGSRICSF
jgi:hypothetical protein